MTLHALRRKPGEVSAVSANTAGAKGMAIGEVDARVFNCPSCARPLADGTSRCPGCGVRLIMGVAIRRASVILILGLVFGVLVGGAAMASIITFSVQAPKAAANAAVADPVAPAGAAPTAVPHLPGPAAAAAPPVAVSALSGTAVVNGRIAVDTATLAAALGYSGTSTIDIARALRSLAADAALGEDLSARMAPWKDALPVKTRLDGFYGALADTARDAFRSSLSDGAAYRQAGTRMLTALAGLGEVDAASRSLATSVGLELPPVVVSLTGGGPKAAPSSAH